jgi:hypothetical protein
MSTIQRQNGQQKQDFANYLSLAASRFSDGFDKSPGEVGISRRSLRDDHRECDRMLTFVHLPRRNRNQAIRSSQNLDLELLDEVVCGGKRAAYR